MQKIPRLYILTILGLCYLAPVFSQNVADVAALIKYGRIDSARVLTDRWSPPDSLSDSQLFLKGLAQKDADDAAALFEILLNHHPASDYADDALFRLAQKQYAEGLYAQSRTKFRTLLANYPRSPLVQKSLLWTGMTYQATGDQDSARIFYNRSVSDKPPVQIADTTPPDIKPPDTNGVDPGTVINNPPPARKLYSVQVGAFSNSNSAKMRKAFFEHEGFEVKLRNKVKDGQQLYLIWVGSFATADEARVFGSRLKKRYGSGYVIVKE